VIVAADARMIDVDGPRRLHAVENVEVRKTINRARRKESATHLVSRKSISVEGNDINPEPLQLSRTRRAGQTASDDDNVRVHGASEPRSDDSLPALGFSGGNP
jgi:hypothetical protein